MLSDERIADIERETFASTDDGMPLAGYMMEFGRNVARAAIEADRAERDGWKPIETCPDSGYFLVYEDEAMRALIRHKGKWETPAYPALVTITPPGMECAEYVMVGDEAARFLQPHKMQLALLDGCCENPTHWTHLPAAPAKEQK